jgi:predicted nucleic acid-binding protein
MKAGKNIIYWDTAVWLAWLTGERHWPETVIAGIEDVILQLEAGKIQLITSSITRSEIFQGRLTTEQKNLWTSITRRSDVRAIAADDRINDRSSAIREYHQDRGVKILTPDAIHLATAVLYKADEFQTMDGLDKSGKPKRVLGLSGNVGGYPLFITHPYPRSGAPTQTHLFLGNCLPDDITNVRRAINLQEDPDEAKTTEISQAPGDSNVNANGSANAANPDAKQKYGKPQSA